MGSSEHFARPAGLNVTGPCKQSSPPRKRGDRTGSGAKLTQFGPKAIPPPRLSWAKVAWTDGGYPSIGKTDNTAFGIAHWGRLNNGLQTRETWEDYYSCQTICVKLLQSSEQNREQCKFCQMKLPYHKSITPLHSHWRANQPAGGGGLSTDQHGKNNCPVVPTEYRVIFLLEVPVPSCDRHF